MSSSASAQPALMAGQHVSPATRAHAGMLTTSTSLSPHRRSPSQRAPQLVARPAQQCAREACRARDAGAAGQQPKHGPLCLQHGTWPCGPGCGECTLRRRGKSLQSLRQHGTWRCGPGCGECTLHRRGKSLQRPSPLRQHGTGRCVPGCGECSLYRRGKSQPKKAQSGLVRSRQSLPLASRKQGTGPAR